jgi:hypothetical protein
MIRSSVGLFLLLIVSVAAFPTTAQTYYCIRPYKSHIPMGSFADHWEMEMAQDEVDDYLRDMREYLDCLSREHDDAAMEAKGVVRDWEIEVDNYNSR